MEGWVSVISVISCLHLNLFCLCADGAAKSDAAPCDAAADLLAAAAGGRRRRHQPSPGHHRYPNLDRLQRCGVVQVFTFLLPTERAVWSRLDWTRVTTLCYAGWQDPQLTALAHSHNVTVVFIGTTKT